MTQQHHQYPIMLQAAQDFLQRNPHAGWAAGISPQGQVDDTTQEGMNLLSAVGNSTPDQPAPEVAAVAIRDAHRAQQPQTELARQRAAQALRDFLQAADLTVETDTQNGSTVARIPGVTLRHEWWSAPHSADGTGHNEEAALADLARSIQNRVLDLDSDKPKTRQVHVATLLI